MLHKELTFGPRLKLERAQEHINQIIDFSSELPNYWFDLSIKTRRSGLGFRHQEYALMFTPIEPIPQLFALIIGDAIHNMRSSLDHLANGLQAKFGTGAKGYFPIEEKRANLANGWKMGMLEEVLPGSKSLILDELRPEDGSKDLLWSFNDLDNTDKHNLILPTVTVANITGINARIGDCLIEECGAGNDASQPYVALSSTNVPIFMSGTPKTSANLAFSGDSAFHGRDVLQTLCEIKDFVSEIIDSFEILISKRKA